MPGSPKTLVEEFEIEGDDTGKVADLADNIRGTLPGRSQDRHVALAALAQVGAELVGKSSEKSKQNLKLKKAS